MGDRLGIPDAVGILLLGRNLLLKFCFGTCLGATVVGDRSDYRRSGQWVF